MKTLLTAAAIAACLGAAAQTERITFQAPLLYPEGVAYDATTQRFFVSSVSTGTIGTVDRNGAYTELLKDPALKSSYGLKVDAANNRLLVCVSDANYSRYSTPATYKKMARLIGIDLATGRKTLDVNLAIGGPRHFANDMALDDKGNIYITDSYAPNILRVDRNGKASVAVSHAWFQSKDVGLNGILFHPQGFLLVAHNTNGELYKVDPATRRVEKVACNMLFPGADGLAWLAPDMMALVQNKGAHKVYQIGSSDGWRTADVKAATATEDRFQYPTTATVQDGRVWVVNSKMNELTDSTTVPSREFSIQLARFQPVK